MVSRFLVLCECFIVLTVFVMTLSRYAEASDLVDEVCQKDPDHQFCLTALKGNRGSDRYELAAAVFKMAYLDANSSLSYINRLKKNLPDPDIWESLMQCRDDYIDAVGILDQACIEIGSKTYNSLGTYGRQAGLDEYDCRYAFHFKANLLDANNRNLKGYSQIGEAVATLFA